ncbi:hypothetical protein Tco_1390965 [Tanacetum coccineum]
MDIDPPLPPSSSSGPSQKKAVKKLKFTPKPPSRRKLVLPKSDSDDDNEEDAKIARELFRKANVNSLALSFYYLIYRMGLETSFSDYWWTF